MSDSNSKIYTESQLAMTLAALAYAPCGEISGYLSNPSFATSGEWNLVWGPGETSGNQMFVAKNSKSNQFAISIRGTVPQFSLALLIDLYQDLDVNHPKPWDYPVAEGAMVAGGTLDGLNDLIAMTSGGLSLLKFIEASRIPSGGEFIVTGHSLGGALATVFAPWLDHQLLQTAKTTNIKVYTFAAPTAGNQAFANMYNSKFSQSFRYHNDIDVIPKAWADLSGIKELYPAPGPACPWEMKDTVDVVNVWLSRIDKVVYVQPDEGIRLKGRADSTEDFLKELGDQHGHNNYLALLGAPLLPF